MSGKIIFREKEIEKAIQRMAKHPLRERVVEKIINKVKRKGDEALIFFTKKFDGAELRKENLAVSRREIKKAYSVLGKKELNALKRAKKNIAAIAKRQLPKSWLIKRNDSLIGETVKPLDSVGIYVPGGKHPLASSVLMNAIPAKVAGVKEITMCTPPNKAGGVAALILVAADLCAVNKIFKVGGAQAIAAMAFGTQTVPAVCKVVGPGNIYVSAAKKQLFGQVGIDFLAGPSEIVVLAEEGSPKVIAADLLAQLEHDADAKAVFVTTSKKLAKAVSKQLPKKSGKNCFIILTTLDKAIRLVNEIAPEHLQILSKKKQLIKKIRNAGAIFVGESSPVAFGDYCTGTNHVLPTDGFARFRGGLSSRDFVKIISFQQIGKNEFKKLAPIAKTMASMEGMLMHKKSIEAREAIK